MFSLDNRTILFVQIFIGIISSVYAFIPSGSPRRRLLYFFKAANISYLGGFILLLFQGALPVLLTIITANTLIFMGFVFFSITALELYGLRWRSSNLIVFITVHVLLFLFFTYIRPHTFSRILIISLEIILFLAISQYKILKFGKGKGIPRTGLLHGIQFAYCGILLFRIIFTAVLHFSIDSIFSIDIATSVIFLGTIAFHLSMNLIIVLILLTKHEQDAEGHIQLLEKAHQELTDLNSSSSRCRTQNDVEELYGQIARFLMKVFPLKGMIFFFKDAQKDALVPLFSFNVADEIKEQFSELPMSRMTVSGTAIKENRPVIFEVADYPDFPAKTVLEQYGYEQIASFPIHSKRGSYGTITLGFTEGYRMDQRATSFLQILCNQLGSIMENGRLYETLNRLASSDPLTGIFNRREILLRLKEEFAKAKRNGRPLSLLMMDIDHFKQVNDNFGHDTGDFVLKEVVRCVSGALRQVDLFGRYGGEEFLIILGETDRKDAVEIAERIRLALGKMPIRFQGRELKVTVSLGGALAAEDMNAPEMLVSLADERLYTAKQEGRNRTVFP